MRRTRKLNLAYSLTAARRRQRALAAVAAVASLALPIATLIAPDRASELVRPMLKSLIDRFTPTTSTTTTTIVK